MGIELRTYLSIGPQVVDLEGDIEAKGRALTIRVSGGGEFGCALKFIEVALVGFTKYQLLVNGGLCGLVYQM